MLRSLVVAVLAASLYGFSTYSNAAASSKSSKGGEATSATDSRSQRISRATLLVREGKYREALTELQAGQFGGNLEIPAQLLRAQILDQIDTTASWKIYSTLLASRPDDPVVNLRAGVSSLRRGDRARAIDLLMRSWSIARLPEAAYYLGVTYEGSGEREEAVEFYSWCVGAEGDAGYWRRMAETRIVALSAHPAQP